MSRDLKNQNIPAAIKQFWSETATTYTHDDIEHLEPDGLSAIFLKMLILGLNYYPDPSENADILRSSDEYFLHSSEDFALKTLKN